MSTLRVLTYNVLSLRRGVDRVAAVVAACEPDVVCVQEAPRFLFWRRRCRELAARSGLTVVTGGRPAAAVMLLARPGLRVTERRDVKLRWHPPRHRRGVAIARFEVDGYDVVVATTHLSLDPAERLDQAAAVLALLRGHGAPAVLGADVNEEPGAPAFALLAAEMNDAYAAAPDGDGRSSTAAHPRRRIDAVFADRGLRVLACGVPDVGGIEAASDHRPVLAVLDLRNVG